MLLIPSEHVLQRDNGYRVSAPSKMVLHAVDLGGNKV